MFSDPKYNFSVCQKKILCSNQKLIFFTKFNLLMGEKCQQDEGHQQLQHKQPPEHGRGEVIHTLLHCVLVRVYPPEAELGSQLGLSLISTGSKGLSSREPAKKKVKIFTLRRGLDLVFIHSIHTKKFKKVVFEMHFKPFKVRIGRNIFKCLEVHFKHNFFFKYRKPSLHPPLCEIFDIFFKGSPS